MMLDDRGVSALGKVSEERKLAELARAQVVCAPSLHGESFGMVLTEAFAAGAPVVASDIPGYRDVLRDGVEGLLVPPGDALALAEALRGLALEPQRARARWRRRRASAPSASPGRTWRRRCSTATRRRCASGVPATRKGRIAVRYGLAPADLQPRIPAERLPSLQGPRPLPSALPAAARSARAAQRRARAVARRRRGARAARVRSTSGSTASPPACSPPSRASWRPGWR